MAGLVSFLIRYLFFILYVYDPVRLRGKFTVPTQQTSERHTSADSVRQAFYRCGVHFIICDRSFLRSLGKTEARARFCRLLPRCGARAHRAGRRHGSSAQLCLAPLGVAPSGVSHGYHRPWSQPCGTRTVFRSIEGASLAATL